MMTQIKFYAYNTQSDKSTTWIFRNHLSMEEIEREKQLFDLSSILRLHQNHRKSYQVIDIEIAQVVV